jgi:hypothetical protein
VSFYVSTATFFLLHCDEWDRVVALPRHKFATGATLLQLIAMVCLKKSKNKIAGQHTIYLSHPCIGSGNSAPSFTVFTVFRLLTDFVWLYNYEFWLSLCKIVRSSVILLLPLFTRSLHVHISAFLLIRAYVSCREKHVISIERSDIDGLVENGVKHHDHRSSSSGQLYICWTVQLMPNSIKS